MIATSATLEHRIYDSLIEKNSMDCITPDEFEQALI